MDPIVPAITKLSEARKARRFAEVPRLFGHGRGADGSQIPSAMGGPDPGPLVIFREPGGLFTRERQAIETRSMRCGEPLARARFRPPYVRNHCYAGAHSGTP